MKLLVVEDEVRMAHALRRGLQAEGFTVDLAHDGEEGLRLALEGDYAALVLDVMLPRLSGYRVAQALRAAGTWVPVLMLSAKDGGAPDRPAVLAAGDLTLDPATREVQRAGAEIALTPREFSVLEYLMRRRGEVVTKTEILQHVWDSHYSGDPNVVEVYVGYLRRKIDAPFDRQGIETVRGVGYRLAADGG